MQEENHQLVIDTEHIPNIPCSILSDVIPAQIEEPQIVIVFDGFTEHLDSLIVDLAPFEAELLHFEALVC
jgi:hypothetical protein